MRKIKDKYKFNWKKNPRKRQKKPKLKSCKIYCILKLNNSSKLNKQKNTYMNNAKIYLQMTLMMKLKKLIMIFN